MDRRRFIRTTALSAAGIAAAICAADDIPARDVDIPALQDILLKANVRLEF